MSHAKALYEYAAAQGDELSIAEDEVLTVIKKEDDGWTMVRNERGQQGLVPTSYIQDFVPPAKTAPPPPPPAPKSPAPNAKPTVVAKYDFTAGDANNLSFSTGDTFTLEDSSNTDWWLVKSSSGKQGYVPANYVEKTAGAPNPSPSSGGGGGGGGGGQVFSSFGMASSAPTGPKAPTVGGHTLSAPSTLKKSAYTTKSPTELRRERAEQDVSEAKQERDRLISETGSLQQRLNRAEDELGRVKQEEESLTRTLRDLMHQEQNDNTGELLNDALNKLRSIKQQVNSVDM